LSVVLLDTDRAAESPSGKPIGAIFGWIIGSGASDYTRGFGWGAAYGFAWWILGGLVLMPLSMGMSPFAPLMMPQMRMVAVGSLVGHLVYGLILGGAFVALRHRAPVRTV